MVSTRQCSELVGRHPPERLDEFANPLRRRRRAIAVEEVIDRRDGVRPGLELKGNAVGAQRALGARDGFTEPAHVDGAGLTPGTDVEIEVEHLIGTTTACGLEGEPILDSRANGALMRVSPLGIFGWKMEPEALAKLAAEDAALTHPNRICQQVNGLYATAIAEAVREGPAPKTLHGRMAARAERWNVDQAIRERIEQAQTRRPPEYSDQMGWVLTAFQNALYELLHAPTLEEGIVATVGCGGDTDTNAAICGALLGAVNGRDAVPGKWVDRIVKCRPTPGTTRPRPEEYWPDDGLRLAEHLLQAGATTQ